MASSYPIWVDVTACIYSGGKKSYGVKSTGEQTIYVGSSRKHSHEFLSTTVTKREASDEIGNPIIIFKYSVDGVVLKEAHFEDDNGKAGKYIKTISNLKKIK